MSRTTNGGVVMQRLVEIGIEASQYSTLEGIPPSEEEAEEMASLPRLLLAVLSLPLILLGATALASPISSQTDSRKNQNSLIFEIQEANLKLAQLESVFERSIQDVNAKSVYIRHSDKKIQDMNQDIDNLQTTLTSIEGNTSSSNEKLRALEEQIQLLWDVSRKNNFEIHTLEFKAHEAEKRLNLVTKHVEEMADIVSEQWIQIQQLEQALQLVQLRASKVRRQLRSTRCPFVKSVKNLLGEYREMLKGILDPYVSDGGHVMKSCISKASHHLKRTFTAAKHCHHQLQGYIKESMLRNQFTAVLANDEVVFLVASALITFPVLSLCMLLLSSRFS